MSNPLGRGLEAARAARSAKAAARRAAQSKNLTLEDLAAAVQVGQHDVADRVGDLDQVVENQVEPEPKLEPCTCAEEWAKLPRTAIWWTHPVGGQKIIVEDVTFDGHTWKAPEGCSIPEVLAAGGVIPSHLLHPPARPCAGCIKNQQVKAEQAEPTEATKVAPPAPSPTISTIGSMVAHPSDLQQRTRGGAVGAVRREFNPGDFVMRRDDVTGQMHVVENPNEALADRGAPSLQVPDVNGRYPSRSRGGPSAGPRGYKSRFVDLMDGGA